MKWIRIFGIVLCVMSSCFAYAKTYVIGVGNMNPPMSMQTDNQGHFVGFEIDLMNEICARLHMTCAYKAVVSRQIIAHLELGDIDFAIDGIIIPKFTLFGVLLSIPYLQSHGQFMALSTSSIKTKDEIESKLIGVRAGALQVTDDSDMYINHVFKSIPKVKVYNSIPELIDALDAKKVDVIFVTKYTSDYWTNANQGDYKLIGDSFDIGNGYGIMTLTQNQSIMVSMNAVIRAMMDDGFYSKIFQRYFGAFQ